MNLMTGTKKCWQRFLKEWKMFLVRAAHKMVLPVLQLIRYLKYCATQLLLNVFADSFCTDDTELSSSSGSSSPEPGCVSSSVRDSINQMVMELKCCTEVHNTVLNSKFIFLSSLSALPLCALVTFTYISYSYFYGDLYSWIYLFHLFIWCLSPN